jgi:hypothetical protein
VWAFDVRCGLGRVVCVDDVRAEVVGVAASYKLHVTYLKQRGFVFPKKNCFLCASFFVSYGPDFGI